jgi:hypothetical protein
MEMGWTRNKNLEHGPLSLMNISILLSVPIFSARQEETQKNIHSYQGYAERNIIFQLLLNNFITALQEYLF